MAISSYLKNLILEEEELAQNTENRTPVIFCLDCSFSMLQQRRLERVMEGLKEFCQEIFLDLLGHYTELCSPSLLCLKPQDS